MAGGTRGWNRPRADEKERCDKGPPIWRGVAAGAAVVAVLAVVVGYLFFAGSANSPLEPSNARPPKKAQESPHKPTNPKAAEGEDAEKKSLAMPKPSGRYIEKRDEVAAPQSLEELQSAMTNAPAKKKATFKNGAEQLIALATPSEPGGRVPPLPPITNESVARELKEAMEHVIEAEDDDSAAVLGKKVVVAAAKNEFRELRDSEGYTFAEYLNALRDQANLNADFLAEAHKMSEELYHDEKVSDGDYIKYRDQINEKLKERGLPVIE